MANSRPKAPKFTSFKGTFKYPKVNAPDTKFKADGEYSVKLIGNAQAGDVLNLIAKLEPLHRRAIENAEVEFTKLPAVARKKLGKVTVNPLYTELLDETTEEPTGDIEFKFARAASGTYKSGPKKGEKWTATIGKFDAKGVEMTKAPDIWGGTVGRVSFEVGINHENGAPGYFIPGTAAAGLSLKLQAVQIIDLVSGGQRTAAGHGFGEEDGYSYEPSDDAVDEAAEKTAEVAAGDDADF